MGGVEGDCSCVILDCNSGKGVWFSMPLSRSSLLWSVLMSSGGSGNVLRYCSACVRILASLDFIVR